MPTMSCEDTPTAQCESPRTVTINLDRQTIKDAPVYDDSAQLERDAEVAIHNHYDRQGYWLDQRRRAVA
jgi:hypothetical protein